MSLAFGGFLLGLGGLLCAINFYTSFLRYSIHRLRGGRKEDFRWISGYPIVGSLLVGIAWIVWMEPFDSATLDRLCLVLVLVDTGGLHWFVGQGVVGALMDRAAPDETAQ